MTFISEFNCVVFKNVFEFAFKVDFFFLIFWLRMNNTFFKNIHFIFDTIIQFQLKYLKFE